MSSVNGFVFVCCVLCAVFCCVCVFFSLAFYESDGNVTARYDQPARRRMTLDEEWCEVSVSVANDPDNFASWEKLIEYSCKGLNKASSRDKIETFRTSYEQFLKKWSFCERYWINYAQLEWQLGNTDRCLLIYRRSLSLIPHSNLIWISYLKLLPLCELEYQNLLAVYREAELRIGLHYHSYEFWRLYLELEENHRGKSIYWFNLLKKIVEIPIYNYSYFFQLLFDEIENLNQDNILLMVTRDDLVKKLKLQHSLEELDLKRINYRDLKSKLKKIYTDAYITTQFKSFELYEYEKGVKLEFYSPQMAKSYQELDNWSRYLQFIVINGDDLQIRQLFHRALVPLCEYPDIWLQFAQYYISSQKIQDAKHVLYKSLLHLRGSNKSVVQLKLVKLELSHRNYLKARDILLYALGESPNNVELLLQLIHVEKYISTDPQQFNEFLVQLVTTQNDTDVALELFKQLPRERTDAQLRAQLSTTLHDDARYWILTLDDMLITHDVSSVLELYNECVSNNRLHHRDKLVQWHAQHLTRFVPSDYRADCALALGIN